jgi:Sulfotransferase domain
MKSREKNGLSPTENSGLLHWFRTPPVTRVDFIIGGVQKAGTTAFHDFLAQHPHVALLRDQALHFFDKEDNFAPRCGPHGHLPSVSTPDYNILHGNFDPPRNWKIAGEVTADYLYYPGALERIAAYNPAMKLIVCLRNPIDRAFSQWNMRRAKGREALPFLDAIKCDVEMGIHRAPRGNAYIARSLYSGQLERAFELFLRENVLVFKYEDLRHRPEHVVRQLFNFLGLEPRKVKNKHRNVGIYSRKITPEEREFAYGFFEDDIPKVETLLGWDCSDWRSTSASSAALSR